MTDAQKLAHLRQAIKNVIDGNYPSPRSYRPAVCRHGTVFWECCERCIEEYLTKSLKEVA